MSLSDKSAKQETKEKSGLMDLRFKLVKNDDKIKPVDVESERSVRINLAGLD